MAGKYAIGLRYNPHFKSKPCRRRHKGCPEVERCPYGHAGELIRIEGGKWLLLTTEPAPSPIVQYIFAPMFLLFPASLTRIPSDSASEEEGRATSEPIVRLGDSEEAFKGV